MDNPSLLYLAVLVLVGLLTLGGQVAIARTTLRANQRNLDAERDARLFEQRRQVYAEHIERMRLLYVNLFQWHLRGAKKDPELMDRAASTRAQVDVIGSSAAADAARKCQQSILDYAFPDPPPDGEPDRSDDEQAAFVEQLRSDLVEAIAEFGDTARRDLGIAD